MSRAKTDVWMPLYIADYLADTNRLTTIQHGAYLLLIMDYWRNGAIPDDDSILAQITKMQPGDWALIRASIVRFFTIYNGNLVHKRIENEKEKATGNKQAKSASGSIGAASKWGNSENENKIKRSERLANARQLARHSAGEWEALKQICGEACLICGSIETLVKDHIKPIYQGGSDGVDNLQPLCHSCNSSKGSDSTDHRPNDWQECMAKRLANASLTPNPSPSPSPSPLKTPKPTPAPTPSKSKAIAPLAQFSLPDWIDKAHWDLWVKTRKKKMLPEQMQAQIDKLDEWRKKGFDHCGALANSALNGYTGLFLPDAPRKTGFLTAQQQRDENNRKSSEEFVAEITGTKGRVFENE